MSHSPKIHQVKTRLVNSYVVEYRDKLLVIDVAVGCHRYVLGFIEDELGRDIHDVELVICTHDDPDHIGGVKRLATLCEAAMAIPKHSNRLDRKLANDPFGIFIRAFTSLKEAFQARMWDMYLNPNRGERARKQSKYHGKKGEAYRKARAKQFYRLIDGESLPGFSDWDVIHTPGHSWDSCCYFHPASKSLMTGDTLLGSAKKERVVIPSIYANTKQMDETLNMLRELSAAAVYPGHGSIIRDLDF